MMNKPISRRSFLKITGLTIAVSATPFGGENAARNSGGAARFGSAMLAALCRIAQVPGEQLDHHAPPLLVRGEGLRAARERNPVEAGLGDGQLRAAARLLEDELDQRQWFARVVVVRVDAVGVPAE